MLWITASQTTTLKGSNGNKLVLKEIRVFLAETIIVLFRSIEIEIMFDVIKMI